EGDAVQKIGKLLHGRFIRAFALQDRSKLFTLWFSRNRNPKQSIEQLCQLRRSESARSLIAQRRADRSVLPHQRKDGRSGQPLESFCPFLVVGTALLSECSCQITAVAERNLSVRKKHHRNRSPGRAPRQMEKLSPAFHLALSVPS